jgi:hypothetical protein
MAPNSSVRSSRPPPGVAESERGVTACDDRILAFRGRCRRPSPPGRGSHCVQSPQPFPLLRPVPRPESRGNPLAVGHRRRLAAASCHGETSSDSSRVGVRHCSSANSWAILCGCARWSSDLRRPSLSCAWTTKLCSGLTSTPARVRSCSPTLSPAAAVELYATFGYAARNGQIESHNRCAGSPQSMVGRCWWTPESLTDCQPV